MGGMPGWPPPPPPALGFLTVSSTERTRQVASEAAVMALILTMAGSQTQAEKLSAMSSARMSTPYQQWFWKCQPGIELNTFTQLRLNLKLFIEREKH